MAKVVRVGGTVVAFVLLTVSALVVIPLEASAASRLWTTDADFTAAGAGGSTPVFLSTEVLGTGTPARVDLVRSTINWRDDNPPPPTPGGLEAPSSVFDQTGSVTVLYGGYNGAFPNPYTDKTWEYDYGTNAWTEIATSPKPPGREYAGMSFDPTEQAIVLYGGFNDSGPLNDTWEYDIATNTWSQVFPPFSPPLLGDTPLAYVASAARHLLVGQSLISGNIETWAYDAAGDTWQQRVGAGVPSGRGGFALAYHPTRDRVVLFGGSFIFTLYDQTFEYNYATDSWAQVFVTGPSGRAGHSMTYSPAMTAVLLFGGQTGAGVSQETWRYTAGGTWDPVSTPSRPAARRYSAFAFDTLNGVAVLYGGLDAASSRLGDTWSLGVAYANAGKYTSVIVDTGAANTDWQFIFWNKTTQPPSTFLRFQLATSNGVSGPWNFVGPGGGPGAYYTIPGTAIWTGHDNQRYLKFLADFGTTDTLNTPSMEDVEIVYNVPPAPPYVVSTDPANVEFNVPLGRWINITFSEPMDTATTSASVVGVNPPGAFVPPLTPVWSSGDTILTLQHSVPWRENTVYQVTVTGNDQQGDPLVPNPVDPNVQNPFVFVTAKQNPEVTKTTPPQGYNGYNLTRPIYVEFSEGMDTSSVTWTVNPPFPGGFGATWSNGDRNLTLNHATAFSQCTEFSVQINGTDKVGLPLIPGLAPNPWTWVAECINPYLVATNPSDLQGDVAVNAPIIIDFSKPMNTAFVTWTLIRGPPVTFSPTWTNGNRRLTLTHSQSFPGCAVYEIRIDGTDTSGYALIDGPPNAASNPWSFVTFCDNPYIIATSPEDGETNVSQVRDVLIAFSETMNEPSVTVTIVPTVTEVGRQWGAQVLLRISYLGFNQCTRYTVTVISGQSTGGLPLVPGPAPNPWSFDTICEAPYVTATDPADGATLVPVNKAVVIDYSEPMDPGNTIFIADTVPPGGFVPAFTPTWSNGDRTATLDHAADFLDCTTYELFTDGVGQDGNSLLVGPQSPGAPNPWTFTTRCAGFYITRTDPADGQQDVPQTASIVVEFSQQVDVTSFILSLSPGGIVLDAPAWSQGDTVVTVSHTTTPFVECTTYTATVTARNMTGASLQTGIPGAKPNPWSFKVRCVPPQILSTFPVDGATGVLLAAPIIVTFSEAMNPGSVSWTMLPSIPLTPTWSGGNTVLTLSHSLPFLANTQYCITIRGNDVDGNPLVPGPVPNPWCFTTTTGPTPPRALQVIRSPPNDILLTWQSVTGASSYVIHSSLSRFASWPWPQLAEVTTTSYFATGHLSDGASHYYIVRAKDSTGSLGGNSTMGAKIPVSFAFDSGRTNVHWMSLPYRTMYRRASDISNELTSSRIDVVAKWNPATQSSILWFYFRGAWRGTDFALSPGDGFFIGIRASFSWVINGTDGPVSRTFSVYPNANVNWISLPYTSAYQRASDIVLDIEGSLGGGANTRIVEVARWDPVTQSLARFSWTPGGWSGTDFALAPSEGIYLKVVATFTWTPRLLTPEVP